MNINRIEELFAIIKENTKTFGGDKELYKAAFDARTAIKYGNKDLAKRKGFEFASKYTGPDSEYDDLTGVILEFSALVEYAHKHM